MAEVGATLCGLGGLLHVSVASPRWYFLIALIAFKKLSCRFRRSGISSRNNFVTAPLVHRRTVTPDDLSLGRGGWGRGERE